MKNCFSYYGVIGGDKRQIFLANQLAQKGYSVVVYALDKEGLYHIPLHENCEEVSCLKEVLAKTNIIVASIPITKNQVDLVHNSGKEDMNWESLSKYLTINHQLWAGCIPEEWKTELKIREIFYYDFMEDETVTVFNAIATAEGIIAEAILHSPYNLHGQSCLVLGYGRCAKVLAHKLHGINANVTVCARKKVDLMWAYNFGYKTKCLNEIEESEWNEYALIFNTIPKQVLNRTRLKYLKKGVQIFDLASLPGGVDYSSAKEFKIDATIYLGIPGKYAPSSSATILLNCLLN